jgi:nucleoside-diphosphate-sugar epimerase
MKRLLITGATGFVGSPCLRRALRDFEVHAISRHGSCQQDCDIAQALQAGLSSLVSSRPPSLVFHQCDLFDQAAVSCLLAQIRPTHLLHLAWVATPGLYWTSSENYRWVEATKHLVHRFIREGGTRAVLTGTCAEYDWTLAGVCKEFATPTRPVSLYGLCKLEAYQWVSSQAISHAWARLFYLFGPGEHPARLVPSVTRALLSGTVAECTSGEHQRDFLHVDDVADALIHLLQSEVVGPVNIGSGSAVAVRTIIEMVAQECGRPELVRLGARSAPESEPMLLVADVRRLRDEVGWRPRICLIDGLRETVRWWQWRAHRAA